MAAFDPRAAEYKRAGYNSHGYDKNGMHKDENLAARVAGKAGHDNFNDAAGGTYARNLREENAQLGPGHQQPTHGPMFDSKRDGPQGNIAASVYNSDNYDDSSPDPISDEQKFPMMSMRRITKLPYIESHGEGMLQGGYGGYNSKQAAKAAAVYVPPEAGYGVSRVLDRKQEDIENSGDPGQYYGDLREHMRQVGPEGVAPIHVQPRGGRNAYGGGTDEHANLGNGGHRVAIAMELGWTHMRTTSEKEGSGYDEENEYGKHEDYEDAESDNFIRDEQSSSAGPYKGNIQRAQPPGGTGGPREWARPGNSAYPENKGKQWGTGPIEEANARMRPGANHPFPGKMEIPGQQAMQISRPVPNPYGEQPVSGEQFGRVKHKGMTSAIAAGDRAGQLPPWGQS
jgi:hypothetical protein